MPFLRQHSANSNVTRIRVNHELCLKIWESEHRSYDKSSFEYLEGSLHDISPLISDTLPEQRCKRLSNESTVLNEFPVIARNAKEATQFFMIRGVWPGDN
jgi:hypothetical protein